MSGSRINFVKLVRSVRSDQKNLIRISQFIKAARDVHRFLEEEILGMNNQPTLLPTAMIHNKSNILIAQVVCFYILVHAFLLPCVERSINPACVNAV